MTICQWCQNEKWITVVDQDSCTEYRDPCSSCMAQTGLHPKTEKEMLLALEKAIQAINYFSLEIKTRKEKLKCFKPNKSSR